MSAIRPSSALFALLLAACSSASTPKPAPAADTVTIADSGADVAKDAAADVSATDVSATTWTATHSAEHAVSLAPQAAEIGQRLNLYRQRQPYRESR